MRLKIIHRIEYSCDQPPAYALQRLRLVPYNSATQSVRSWSVTAEGAQEEVRFFDHFGNDTRLISIEGEPRTVAIEAGGEVETVNRSGVTGPHRGFAPLWLFLRETPLTPAGEDIKSMVAMVGIGKEVARLHELLAKQHERSAAAAGPTQMQVQGHRLPEAAPTGGSLPNKADARDQAHIFIAAARLLGFPARYVSGYLTVRGVAEQASSHAWAEAHVDGLGWVGFDPVNGISPDDNYVRVATGRDYRDAAPVSGIHLGDVSERLAVSITVEQ